MPAGLLTSLIHPDQCSVGINELVLNQLCVLDLQAANVALTERPCCILNAPSSAFPQ